MSSMKNQTPDKKPARHGTAIWVSDRDGDLLRAMATAEDRTQQVVMGRALRAYAKISVEYNRSKEKPNAGE